MRFWLCTFLFLLPLWGFCGEFVLDVVSANSCAGARPVVRTFAEDVVRDFVSRLQFPKPRENLRLKIELGYEGVPGVGNSVYLERGERPVGVVRIPFADEVLESELRCNIVAALFRLKLHEGEAMECVMPPKWFMVGLGACTDKGASGVLFERAYSRWCRAGMENLSVLLDRRDGVKDFEAAQVCAWCLSKDNLSEKWAELLFALSSGEKWSWELIGRIFGGSVVKENLDDDFDLFMASRNGSVLVPGSFSVTDIKRLWLNLVVFPCEMEGEDLTMVYRRNMGFVSVFSRGLSMRTKILKASRVRECAFGRDRNFATVCEAIADAILSPDVGAKESRDMAFAMLRKLEKELKNGK